MLGSHIMDRMCGDGREPLELSNLIYGAIAGLKDAKPDDLEGPFRLNREFLRWLDECVVGRVAVAPPAPAPAYGGEPHAGAGAETERPVE
jgi:hypothetical protein